MARFLFLTLTIINSVATASNLAPQSWPPQPNNAAPCYYNIYNPGNQKINASSNSNASNNVEQEQNQTQTLNQKIDVAMTVKHEIVWPEIKMPDLYGYATSPFCTLQNMACENKLKIVAATLIATYGWILYRIKQTESLLQQHDAWCNWKSAVPIAHLMLTTPQDLLHQLKLDMHKKYALMASSVSTCKFANMLINDLQHELQLLETYAQWHTITKRIWCNKLFFFQHDMTSIAEKKIRILFILDLFMAQYAKE